MIQALIWLVLFGSSAFAGSDPIRLNKNGVALCAERDSNSNEDCYDPVSYFEDHQAKAAGPGAKKFQFKFGEATYVFTSQAHLAAFAKDPHKYLPQFGGWCAYAVAAKKDKVDIDPKSFHVQNGRLLLFYDGFLADTRKTWLNDSKQNPEAYLKSADKNWPSVEKKAP